MLFSSIRRVLLLVLPLLLLTFHGEAGALSLNKTSVALNDSRITDHLRFSVELDNPERFYITLSAPDYNAGHSDIFVMTPESAGVPGRVSFIMELPFFEQKQSLPGSGNNPNRIRNNVREAASSSYSLCPEPVQFAGPGKVCKPLSFRVVDDEEAIPGIIYSTRLSKLVEDTDGRQYLETIEVSYRKSGSPLTVSAREKELKLNSANQFSTSTEFCVSSPAYSHFDIRFEPDRSERQQFLLTGSNNTTLPYMVDVEINGNPYPVIPGQWITGERTVIARNEILCGGRDNVRLSLNIPHDTVKNSKPGTYQGVLTAWVKAK